MAPTQVQVLPDGAPKPEEERVPQNHVLRALLFTHGGELAIALLLSVCTLPVVLLLARAYNHDLDIVAESHDVRRQGNYAVEDAWTASSVVDAVMSCSASLIYVVSGRALVAASGQRPTWSMVAGEWLLLLCIGGSKVVAMAAGFAFNETYETLFGTVGVFVNLTSGWLIARTSRIRGAVPLYIGLGVGLFGFATFTSLFVFPWFFDSSVSDTERILYRSIGHPFMADICSLPMRSLARIVPGVKRPELLLLVEAEFRTGVNLVGRIMLAGFESGWATTAAVIAVSVVELLMRATMARRDALMLAPWFGGSYAAALEFLRSAQSRRVHAVVLFVDEVSELWATLVAAMLSLALRLGPDRAAPSAGTVLAVMAAQFGAEFGLDILPGLAATLSRRKTRTLEFVREILLRRERGLRAVGRRFWFGWYPWVVLTSLLWFLVSVMTPGRHHVYCAWSRNDDSGDWHRVPCSESERWL